MTPTKSRRHAPPVPNHVARLHRLWPLTLGVLFLVSCAWRIHNAHSLQHSLLANSLSADARIYWEWASAIIRSGPLGHNPFFLGPLYPYVLALIRRCAGDSVGAVLLVQSLWGALATALLADAARRLTSPLIGLVVGVFMAGYQMAVFFDGLILMESLLYVLEAILLWLVVRDSASPAGAVRLVAVGVVIGLLAQGRALALLLLAPAVFYTFHREDSRARAMRRCGYMVLACGLVCVPTALRNRVVSGEWIPITYNLGYNLYVGNGPRATGSFVPITGLMDPLAGQRVDLLEGGGAGDGREYIRIREGRELSPMQSSAYWAQRTWEYVRQHPRREAALLLMKVGMLWNRREYPQIESYDVFRRVIGLIGWPAVGSFATLCLVPEQARFHLRS